MGGAAKLRVIALAAAALTAGCGADSGTADPAAPTPRQAVAEAARQTFDLDAAALSIAAASPRRGWAAEGLIKPGGGRFRVEAEQTPEAGEEDVVVVGLGGEGYENTVQETVGGVLGRGDGERACWLNPHAPVGFYADPISVEESVRLTGAIVESMREEIATATEIEADRFEVELESTAAQPRDDFRDRSERVWGDRVLLDGLRGPISVQIEGGHLWSIAYALDHRPSYALHAGGYEGRRVRVRATVTPADSPLTIENPGCGGIE